MTELSIPELCLVALVGSTGSGKSTFARKHFRPTAIVSSDTCRGIVSDDENDQSATDEAFALLHHIAGVRLRRGLRTVVDATNVQARSRQELIRVAREHDVLPVAIVLDVPDRVCLQRNALRPERSHLTDHVVARHQRDLRRSLRGLEREGFRRVYVLRGVDEIEAATVVDEKSWTDKRELTGPFDIIGDVHGCRAELEDLLGTLGYRVHRDDSGRPVDARHPDGRTAVFVGDLVDRGPDTPGVLRLVMGMVSAGNALCVTGNHENKLVRALDGRKVTVAHGLAESLAQLAAESAEFRAVARDFCHGLLSHYVLDGGNLVVAHAGLKQEYHGRASGRVRSFAMYGETTGETDEYGLPVRYPWAEEYRGRATVLYGHTPVADLHWVNNTLCLDTGVVFGGRLTALRYPEREPISVPARQVWYEPVRPLTSSGVDGVRHGDPGVLDLDDVIGRRVVETGHLGRVSVQEENAGAALEVMSRYAVDPRWLVHLPPTMSPCATSGSDDLLEHPAQAFDYFRSEGVTTVVCEEKHMGSRAIVVLARTAEAARDRFGVDDGTTGALYTRTGRPFFDDPALTEAILSRVRAAAESAGLFTALDTSWLVLDAELLPWSAKAMGLLREQYAAVGAAARTALNAAESVLAATAARGVDVGELAARTTARRADADAFTAAYGRYCWPVDGLAGVRLAPFQILAGEGANYAVREHLWHLERLDTLVTADPDLFTPTARVVVDLGDADSEAAATTWWSTLTTAGGEGMVVKPADALVHGTATRSNRLVQPGVKCRGPEYLRIIYGPEYRHPANLARLRARGLGRKRSLALREYALGLEALDRLVAGDPLWRIHEAVFAILALESEPIDPRL
ncbi:polynucleotide kinase-phosphatase [Nocardia aurantia]|uniref:Bis(5'-nucleosyl)-tetraphosphatase, symmetrical n=1 Tax=Nocardia aurantia TaxID=2585199 RepID=A0A7K0DL25_9NOCA|nr:polynucleotide kinase-phosphatase [Nocardia aurantia]MQY26480.1 Bis(5'-nucleosyl)-tetraphosphatase, symmetrical [Nocardia aurantia]